MRIIPDLFRRRGGRALFRLSSWERAANLIQNYLILSDPPDSDFVLATCRLRLLLTRKCSSGTGAGQISFETMSWYAVPAQTDARLDVPVSPLILSGAIMREKPATFRTMRGQCPDERAVRRMKRDERVRFAERISSSYSSPSSEHFSFPPSPYMTFSFLFFFFFLFFSFASRWHVNIPIPWYRIRRDRAKLCSLVLVSRSRSKKRDERACKTARVYETPTRDSRPDASATSLTVADTLSGCNWKKCSGLDC